MKKILTLTLTFAITGILSVAAAAQTGRERMQPAYDLNDQAWAEWKAYNWDAGISLMQQAIEASPDSCTDFLYGEYIKIALEAKDLRFYGRSDQVAYQYLEGLSNSVEADCYP